MKSIIGPDGQPIPIAVVLKDAYHRRAKVQAALGRRSFYRFVEMAWRHVDAAEFHANWHLELLCDELERAYRGEESEVVFCVPPRTGKSKLISVLFPVWVWINDPARQFITASYDVTLAMRDALASRRLVESGWFQARWPHVKLMKDQNQKGFYQTTELGHRLSTAPGAGLTGHGGDIVLFDDPHNVNKAESDADRESAIKFWFEAMPTRHNDQSKRLAVVIQQRVHREDVAGECIRRGWHRVVLPMRFEPDHPERHPRDPRQPGESLHPRRFPESVIAALEEKLGPYAHAGQNQQRPQPREGGIFKRGDFAILETMPADVVQRIRRWDLAGTSQDALVSHTTAAYTAGVRMARTASGKYIIEHVERFRASPETVETRIKNIAAQDGRSITIGLPQDPGQAGVAQVKSYTRALAGYVVLAERESGDKFTRALPFAAQVAAGNVALLRGAWNEAFLDEVTSFPSSSFKDQVDAASGGFNMMMSSGGGLLQLMRIEADKVKEQQATETMKTEVIDANKMFTILRHEGPGAG